MNQGTWCFCSARNNHARGVPARYWEVDDCQPPATPKLPYRIELVGVTCDPGLAVARGIWCARRPPAGRTRQAPLCLALRVLHLGLRNLARVFGRRVSAFWTWWQRAISDASGLAAAWQTCQALLQSGSPTCAKLQSIWESCM